MNIIRVGYFPIISEAFDVIGNGTIELLRSLLWAVASVMMWFIDILWEIILKIATLDFYTKANVGDFFTLFSTLMILFIIYRIIKVTIRLYVNEEEMMRSSSGSMVIKIVLISMAISTAPFVYKAANTISLDLIDNVQLFLPNYDNKKTKIKISQIIMDASAIDTTEDVANTKKKIAELNKELAALKKKKSDRLAKEKKEKQSNSKSKNTQNNSSQDYRSSYQQGGNSTNETPHTNAQSSEDMEITQKENEIKTKQENLKKMTAKYDDSEFNINLKNEEGIFVNFPSWGSILLLVIECFLCVKQLYGLALSIAKRSLLIIFQYLMAPHAISSLVDPKSNEFGRWVDLIITDLLMNFIQIYAVYFVLMFVNSNALAQALNNDIIGAVTKFIVMIAGFSAIDSLPQHLRTIMGGNATEGISSALRSAGEVNAGGRQSGAFALGGATALSGVALSAATGTVAGGMNNQGLLGKAKGSVAGGLKSGFGSIKDGISTKKAGSTFNRTKENISDISSSFHQNDNAQDHSAYDMQEMSQQSRFSSADDYYNEREQFFNNAQDDYQNRLNDRKSDDTYDYE